MPRGRLSPNLVTYHHQVATIQHDEVNRESGSASSQGDPPMSCTSLPKAAKLVWANQLTRLPCLVVYVKFPFAYITTSKTGSQLLLASTSSNVPLGRGSEKAFNEGQWYTFLFPEQVNDQKLQYIIKNFQLESLA